MKRTNFPLQHRNKELLVLAFYSCRWHWEGVDSLILKTILPSMEHTTQTQLTQQSMSCLFVWPIFFSALLILHFSPSIFNLPNLEFSLCSNHVILVWNVGFLVALLYSLFYVALDLKAGSLAAVLCALCWVGSSFVATQLRLSLAWKVVLVVQLVCWTHLFIGHGVFEKRAPALLDNLIQAFVMGPFFVLLEVLHTLFGYEPYPGFHSKVQAKVEANINEWQESKQKLS